MTIDDIDISGMAAFMQEDEQKIRAWIKLESMEDMMVRLADTPEKAHKLYKGSRKGSIIRQKALRRLAGFFRVP